MGCRNWVGYCCVFLGGTCIAGCGDDVGATSGAEASSASVAETSGGAGATSAEASTSGGPAIPAACEEPGLPAPQGQGTQAGHFTTVAEFDAADLEQWLGETPTADRGVLVLVTHPEYDCDRLLTDDDLNHGYGYSQQLVYVFPGPIEVGTYAVGVDVRAWSVHWLGDGGGNGGGGAGEVDEGTLTIVSVDAACVTGTQPQGFAVSMDPSCG